MTKNLEFFQTQAGGNLQVSFFINVEVKLQRLLKPVPGDFVNIEQACAKFVALGRERAAVFQFPVPDLFAFWPGQSIQKTRLVDRVVFGISVKDIDRVIFVVAVFWILAVLGNLKNIVFGQNQIRRAVVNVADRIFCTYTAYKSGTK